MSVLILLFLVLLYARWVEAYWLKVYSQPVTLSGLPPAFDGLCVVQLTDLHLGPWVSEAYLSRALALANSLKPDVIVLTGDCVHRSPDYIAPVYRLLAQLRAPLGVYAVLGNHDQWEDPPLERTREAMKQAGLVDLTNRAVPLERQGQKLWLAGVADLWTERPDLKAALVGVPAGAPVVLLSHNPDFAEQASDPRVALMLAGHTHGGQVNLPLLGPVVVPSKYGNKYAAGLVRDGDLQVYVSRGVGMVTPAVRLRCRPEVTLLTLRAAPPEGRGE